MVTARYAPNLKRIFSIKPNDLRSLWSIFIKAWYMSASIRKKRKVKEKKLKHLNYLSDEAYAILKKIFTKRI